jgi:hypothetical protein
MTNVIGADGVTQDPLFPIVPPHPRRNTLWWRRATTGVVDSRPWGEAQR